MKPLAFDLCAGKGGWTKGLIAAGWDAYGFEINESFREGYPGSRFYCIDVRLAGCYLDDISEHDRRRLGLIVASPPCEEFSRHTMPWTRVKNPPKPDKSIWEACEHISRELAVPLILENVREAQNWIRKADYHFGPYYLWGNVPALMPHVSWNDKQKKESFSSSKRAERAVIPFELALHIGKCFLPQS